MYEKMKSQACLITGWVPWEAGSGKEVRELEVHRGGLGRSVHWKGRNQDWAEGEAELQCSLGGASVVLQFAGS